MKSFFVAAAALCSFVTAAPAVLTPPPAGTQFYQLQTKSATTALNNQYVSLKTGQTTYSLGPQAGAAKFFFRKYDPTGTWSFYNSDDTRQVALLGPNSVLLNFVDFTNPTAGSIPGGQFMEWGTFTTDSNVVGVKDGSTLTNRTFVAVKAADNSYSVAFYDGLTATTQNITPITLNIQKVA